MDRWMLNRFDQTVTRNAKGAVGFDRSVTYSTTAQTYRARVETALHLVTNGKGEEVLARTAVYLAPTSTGGVPVFTAEDQITLPDGTTPDILSVETLRDFHAPHHQVVHCG